MPEPVALPEPPGHGLAPIQKENIVSADQPLVTAILPVFNREASIARAIESVLGQTYGNVELIVVDDGSTDGTADILARYSERATILAQSNGGAYKARNLALRRARGELVAFVDSDDAWLPDKLARQVPLMRRPEVGLVFGDVRIVRPAGAR
jgi:glycosyltransferase involved in cell wall biosynthesis